MVSVSIELRSTCLTKSSDYLMLLFSAKPRVLSINTSKLNYRGVPQLESINYLKEYSLFRTTMEITQTLTKKPSFP